MDRYFRLGHESNKALTKFVTDSILDTSDPRTSELDFAAATKEAFRRFCAWHRHGATRQPSLEYQDTIAVTYEVLALADVDPFAADMRVLLHGTVEDRVNLVASRSRQKARDLAREGGSIAKIRESEYDAILTWRVEGQHNRVKKYLGTLEVWELTPVVEEMREKGRAFNTEATFYETFQQRLYDAGAEPHELISEVLKRIADAEDEAAQ